MTKLQKENLQFCEDMGWTIKDLAAQWLWSGRFGAKVCAEAYELEELIYQEYLNEYYSDFDAEMLRESMWIANHC